MKKVLIIILVLLILGAIGYFLYIRFNNGKWKIDTVNNSQDNSMQIDVNNKFGWLGADESESNFNDIVQMGGGWMRPHPGPMVWDAMQKGDKSDYNFDDMDKLVKTSRQAGVNLLITLWPFAEWDQQNRQNAQNCAVSETDEFLPKNNLKGRTSYLPSHRCAPVDWDKYQDWVKAVVERYDGDGQNDMQKLQYGIKYWEVMNEPDLEVDESGRLSFWKGSTEDYATLLSKSYQAIKQADSTAQVLIAGAAGGNSQFLSFYENIFKDFPDTKNYFDIGNIHCISNDETSKDFNVNAYKSILSKYSISKPIWVTEAEAFYGKTAEENFNNTKISTSGAINTGAEKIFYTRYTFDDFRKDMSEKTIESKDSSVNAIKWYKEITSSY